MTCRVILISRLRFVTYQIEASPPYTYPKYPNPISKPHHPHPVLGGGGHRAGGVGVLAWGVGCEEISRIFDGAGPILGRVGWTCKLFIIGFIVTYL